MADGITTKTVLLVDDSPTELRIMMRALEGRGYRLVTASDGEEALERISRSLPDLVLLDIILPRKNGFQVCRQLRTSPQTRDLKVILVSSKGMNSDKSWGLQQGADDYLVKPFSDKELVEKVARFTGRDAVSQPTS
jgi:twitching motility two-component system response regulator PilH